MKSSTKQILHLIVGLSLIVFIIFVLFYLAKLFVFWFGSLQNQVATAIVTASATIIITVVSFLASKSYERKRDIEQKHLEQKIPLYEGLIQMTFRVLFDEKLGKSKPTEKELLAFNSEFSGKLIIWGADSVVKEYTLYRNNINSTDTRKSIFQFEKVLLAIRKDVGHKNNNLSRGDLLKIFVNDIDSWLTNK